MVISSSACAVFVGRSRPDSSVVEHFHGKEGVDSSILSRGSAAGELRWLEHTTHNRGVAGSSPASATSCPKAI